MSGLLVLGLTMAIALPTPCAAGNPVVVPDDCADAFVVGTLPYASVVDTRQAAAGNGDPEPPCGDGSRRRNVWYRYTAPVAQTLVVDTFGSDYDTILSAYTGACGALLFVPNACNDDAEVGGVSRVTFDAAPGVTYRFMVSSFGGGGGILHFNVAAEPNPTATATNTATRTPTPISTGPTATPTITPTSTVTPTATEAGPEVAAPDRAAALVLFPYLTVDPEAGTDTIVQIANASPDEPLELRCHLFDRGRRCAGDGVSCVDDGDCAQGACAASLSATHFDLRLTRGQPIVWRASAGLPVLPCDGSCPEANSGSVPPVSTTPFRGFLFCVTVDGGGVPIERNDLHGQATIVTHGGETERLDVAKYAALGFRALRGRNDGDQILVLGGEEAAEYDGCGNFQALGHFLDGAVDPAVPDRRVYTTLVAVPCTIDPQAEALPDPLVGVVLTDDLGVRYQTIVRLEAFTSRRLSDVDPIFAATISGSLTAQSRLNSVGVGFVALAIEEYVAVADSTLVGGNASHLQQAGTRDGPDYFGTRAPVCGDGIVDPGEDCDDGNRAAGDCCSSSCTAETAGTACEDDFNPCTSDRCDGGGTCVHPALDPLPSDCGCCRFVPSSVGSITCTGDCNRDGIVSDLEVEGCALCASACDANGDFRAQSFEIDLAAANRTYGCPTGDVICAAPINDLECELDLAGTIVPFAACERESSAAVDAGCPFAAAPATPTGTPLVTPTPTVGVTPSVGSCCAAGDGPGCDESGCAACVCDVDAFCCTELWDRTCAVIARDDCERSCVCACTGDCDGDGQVVVAELVSSVFAALRGGPQAHCAAADPDDDGSIQIDEIVTAVERSLDGCNGAGGGK